MIVKRFKNGNFNVKMESEDFNKESTLINLIWALQDNDCDLFGEEYCISNYEMGVDMYCYYTGMIVSIPYRVLEELENGKTIKLYAHFPNEWETEKYNELVRIGELQTICIWIGNKTIIKGVYINENDC